MDRLGGLECAGILGFTGRLGGGVGNVIGCLGRGGGSSTVGTGGVGVVFTGGRNSLKWVRGRGSQEGQLLQRGMMLL